MQTKPNNCFVYVEILTEIDGILLRLQQLYFGAVAKKPLSQWHKFGAVAQHIEKKSSVMHIMIFEDLKIIPGRYKTVGKYQPHMTIPKPIKE